MRDIGVMPVLGCLRMERQPGNMVSPGMARLIAASLTAMFPFTVKVIELAGELRYEARADDSSLPLYELITDDAGELWRALFNATPPRLRARGPRRKETGTGKGI